MNLPFSAILLTICLVSAIEAAPSRSLQFKALTPDEARRWQEQSRARLFELLMGGNKPAAVALEPKILQRIEMPAGGYVLEELTLQTLADRRAHVWLATPKLAKGKVGAVLALHGHGGTGDEIVRGKSLYWYGRALAEMGYVVISPDIGSHELQHPNWSLMGERVWDALRCVDYLATRPEVDPDRMAVAGLSLGGETTMYVAALDPRLKAVCSSGWLTTVENMRHGHCPCWNFPGLEEHFDFADIFACIAPRPLICEIGEKEKAPGGFPVEIARRALAEIRPAYQVFGAELNLLLDVHPGGHVFRGAEYWRPLREALGTPYPWKTSRVGLENDVGQAPVGNSRSPIANRQTQIDQSLLTSAPTEELLRRGEIARRNFCRALGVLDSWWATRDRATGLYPRRLDQPVWAPADNAADMLPFLFLTAHYLAPERTNELHQVLRSEKALTDRLGPLPDWYSLTNHKFLYEKLELPRLIFGAAEYCKDGLIPMTEVMGRGPWTDRMFELMDAIFERGPVASEFGALPADDSEVNGDVLQTLGRLYAMTREPKYLQWAERIGDAYCFEVLPKNGGLPPHRWNFQNHRVVSDNLNLNDHGNELIGGLAELYAITKSFRPEKAERYRAPLQNMFQRLLAKARNEDGLWFNLVRASTGDVLNRETPDTWGYALGATLNFATATADDAFIGAVRQALRNIDRPRYLDWNGADSYADSIEGGLILLNRLPEEPGWRWLEKVLPIFLGKQRDDGIVEGWYGDGNYARTALMAGLYFTQGAMGRPWRSDLRFGATQQGHGLQIALAAEKEWEGRLSFDTPRHRRNLNLPVNYPRLNEFPEWFTVESDARYQVRAGDDKATVKSGAELADGLPLHLKAGETRLVEVRRLESAKN